MELQRKPYDEYKQQSVLTAGPMELVIMLYDGLIKQMKLSSIYINEKSFEKSNNALILAQDIVNELLMSLDMSFDISNDLMSLYEYVIHELIQINIEKDVEKLKPLIEMMTELRDTWSAISKNSDAVKAYRFEE